jgi:hypothetical protein
MGYTMKLLTVVLIVGVIKKISQLFLGLGLGVKFYPTNQHPISIHLAHHYVALASRSRFQISVVLMPNSA